MNGNLKTGSVGLPGLFSLISKVTECVPAAGTTAPGLPAPLVLHRNASSREVSKAAEGEGVARGGWQWIPTRFFRPFWLQHPNVTRGSMWRVNAACNSMAASLQFQCQLNVKQGCLYILDIAYVWFAFRGAQKECFLTNGKVGKAYSLKCT